MTAKPINLSVYLWTDIDGTEDCDYEFDSFTHGDAEYTLVSVGQVIKELQQEADNTDGEDESIPDVLHYLRLLPDDSLIAFDG